MLPCMPFNIVFGPLLFCLMMYYLITMNIQKLMMLPSMPFNIVFGRSAILPHDVLFDHHEHSEVHDVIMCTI